MKRVAPGIYACLLTLCSTTLAAPPERVVNGNSLISRAERWDLYDIADCELHLFVEADSHNVVQSLYWIQFEGYLPSNSHVYDYTKDESVIFAGMPFWQRARFGPSNETPRAGSDGERVRQMLDRAGYELPPHTMNVRLVHLLDEARRKELMFIYVEDLGARGFTSDDLMDGDAARPAWNDVKQGLVERARQRIHIVR